MFETQALGTNKIHMLRGFVCVIALGIALLSTRLSPDWIGLAGEELKVLLHSPRFGKLSTKEMIEPR
jgi:hypothetical protein